MKKVEFIISINVGFVEVLTGGVLVLHKLAYELASRGYKVTIFTIPEYPHENIFVEKSCSENNLDFNYDPENTVLIPSFDWKNNTNIKHVARWVLYHINKEQIKNLDETDEVFNFGSFEIEGITTNKVLTVIDYKKNIYFNKNQKRKKKYCHLLLKNNPSNAFEIMNYFESFSLDDWKMRGNFQYLAEKFNEYEYFLTFDDKTFHTTSAAMCGCKPIILKNNEQLPFEYRMKNQIQMVGVAYGMNDLEWAETTLGYVSEHVDMLIEKDKKTINDFINFWKNKITR